MEKRFGEETDQEPVYVTGHVHPDTDSVASAIAYAFYKRAQGVRAVACRLGPLNNETAYLLKKLDIEEPVLLEDARKRLCEIELDPPEFITPETSVQEAVQKLSRLKRNSLAVLKDDRTIAGFVTRSDLADIGLGDTAAEIELLKKTDTAHLAEVIDGTIIYDDIEAHINGKVSIVTLSETKTVNYEIKDRIVVVGNDAESQKDLIERGAGLLITVWTDTIRQDVLEAAALHHCPIIKSGHGAMNTTRFLFLAPPVRLVMHKPVVFRENDLLEEAGEKMLKTRYRDYPVVDSKGHLKGYLTRFHVMNNKNKKIIMVDHNEFSQSVKAVEKAQILEVIDHHRINDFATRQPVSFRNEIVGSTATIVTNMFRENQIPLPKDIAALLLGAVLSDTLMFQSPTTTRKDVDAANILAAIARVDKEQFGKEMFAAAAAKGNMTMYDQIVQDIKYYNIDGVHTMISQVLVSDTDEIRNREEEIYQAMNLLVNKKNLDLLVVAFTCIVENGSLIYMAGEKSYKASGAFPDENHHKVLHKEILSRKLQILPKLTDTLED
ncbi:MAG: putative manganese-dependent inorganic diphosphatase [Solobacterium sp.]|jgi:manganese-dependent inorganic pyrophosphatase|nr:putative manganese-dependent inorganic diphosphatase [Solobacterium sp.]MCH4048648.1 putative manganese-dependent inorganic diphosphatase [Solobacterium sp.]MCH4075661.1 putative manganese-dependent inorganic diphosphatase [Solobacterium sp.]MCI1314670.1 putative manganese-dependent inorganic diphosphatase [Solobacterium sp.]MCI1346923.1 putative manganese-dependent inorganic diphosphatase [Solobacterium sp.]